MKISLNWLRDFITFAEQDPAVIADRVTRSVAEVDEVEVQGALLRDCCVGKVMTVTQHPNADRLKLVDVQTDRGVKRVVCGGTNLQGGMLVAFAHTGATVKWHGGDLMTLEPTKIRGEQSDGMICAAEELGLEGLFPTKPEDGERPIVELHLPEKAVGTPLKEALGLDDVVLHIDNHAITHRADLFSHVGFARELVALGLASWKKSAAEKPVTYADQPLPFTTHIDCPDLVFRYAGCLLQVDGLGETPDWMVRRLEAVGYRSVSLPVDITNYVAAELGTPLHSFDADDFRGDIHIRTSKRDEKIVTLDGEEHMLPDGALVISDDEGIFDLLGIMGGLRSSTKSTTRRIYLHNASLDPLSIRRAIIATGHRTDAGTVYEKGVPPVMVLRGLERTIRLFLELVPGARLASALEQGGGDGDSTPITLPLDRVSRLLGADVSEKEAKRILTDLGFAVTKGSKGSLTVTPPLWRLGDVRTPIDLIEEIGRIHGYDAIEPAMPQSDIRIPESDRSLHMLRDSLKEQRYMETLPLSLTSATVLKRTLLDPSDAITIENPISEDLRLLHTSTLPALLEHANRNQLLIRDQLRTFHHARVFRKSKPEHLEVSLLLLDPSRGHDERDLKSSPLLQLNTDLCHALRTLDLPTEISEAKDPPSFAHPGRCGRITVKGTAVGWVFEIHPTVARNFDLPGTAAAAVIDLNALLALTPIAKAMLPIPARPPVVYDETLTRNQKQPAGELLQKLRAADPLLENVEVIDLYAGKEQPADQYNLTLRFTYRAPDRTLTEEEARTAHANVLQRIDS